ncbi:MAG: hypothetical protein ACOCP8_00260 [archaeon]
MIYIISIIIGILVWAFIGGRSVIWVSEKTDEIMSRSDTILIGTLLGPIMIPFALVTYFLWKYFINKKNKGEDLK